MTRINEFALNLYARLQSRKDEEGAALAEYGLLVALIAVVAIGAITAVGDGVTAKLDQVAGALGG